MESEEGSTSVNAGREVRGYRISGRVQGVGFRWWAQDTASGLGLVGSVWNRPDGSVEVCAAGGADALDALARVLEKGPLGAQVDGVMPVAPDHAPSGTDFRIDHRRG